MTKKQLIETIRRVIKETLEEAGPAYSPSIPQERPGPDVAEPGTEEENEPDKYTLNPEKGTENIPDVAPKATMTEAEMLAKIIKKYRAIKKNG